MRRKFVMNLAEKTPEGIGVVVSELGCKTDGQTSLRFRGKISLEEAVTHPLFSTARPALVTQLERLARRLRVLAYGTSVSVFDFGEDMERLKRAAVRWLQLWSPNSLWCRYDEAVPENNIVIQTVDSRAREVEIGFRNPDLFGQSVKISFEQISNLTEKDESSDK